MLNCDVPNICVFMLCVGWYLLGLRLGKENNEKRNNS